VKATLTECDISPSHIEGLASDRKVWRSTCRSAVERFEERGIDQLKTKRDLRKADGGFQCYACGRIRRSRIGLVAHSKL